ncbi:hypothetical protein DY000_02052904 [Brassica cretica]|uniref:Uncharacterized protein n=1 Tax=Brassica cretica TaxID=69181 RepID=A0ABQ7A6R6_BRACR|nr:hypothetical protein DY000_02052904 [Brassica cretica]
MSSHTLQAQGRRSTVALPERAKAHSECRPGANSKKQEVRLVLCQHEDSIHGSRKASFLSAIADKKLQLHFQAHPIVVVVTLFCKNILPYVRGTKVIGKADRGARQHSGTSMFQKGLPQNLRVS